MGEYDGLIKSLRIIGNERQTTSPNTVCEFIAADVIADLQTRLAAELEQVKRERDEALNELDAVYAALGTSDAEGAPEAAVTIESIFCERDALQARVERLEKALRFYAERMTYTSRTGMECGITKDHFGDRARAALAADGENNDRD